MASTDVKTKNQPKLTRPMWFAFIAFVIFVLFALLPNHGSKFFAITPDEYEELRKFTLFFIGALLPSDALVRFGRSILFSKSKTQRPRLRTRPRAPWPRTSPLASFW